MIRHSKRADHIRIRRPQGYGHDALCLDDECEWVINFRSGPGERKQDASVRIERFDAVVQGDPFEILDYSRCFPPDVVIERALKREGEREYSAVGKNCQAFVRDCKTGDASSDEVRVVAASAKGIISSLGARALTLGTVATLGSVPGKSAAGITSALATAGRTVGAGAKAGVLVLTAAPVVVAGASVGAIYADDPFANHEEREALRGARTAGWVGAIGGALAGSVALGLAGKGAGAIALTTGLKALGAGRMIAGLSVLFGAPAVTAGAAGFAAYRVLKKRLRRSGR